MNNPRFELARTRRDKALDAVLTLALSAWLYYLVNPDAFETIKGNAKERWSEFTHAYSVWQTRNQIRDLPEVPE